MADEEKASSLLSDEQDEDNRSVEMEFKVADINDEVLPGWRLASINDVENYIEQVKLELCGMTFHICSLTDGTVGGPGYGYQITNQIDSTLDHKLLISDASTLSSEDTTMKTNEVFPSATNQDICDNNTTNSNINIELSESTTVEVTSTSLVSEHSSETILTQEYKISTETNIQLQNSNEIFTQETNDSIQPYISSIQNDIENSGNKVEVCVDNSNVEKGCEKIECDNIDTVIQPSVDVDTGNNVDDVVNKSFSSDTSDKSIGDKEKPRNAGSSNDTEVSKVDTSNNNGKSANVSDLESGKSSESSPSVKKKKIKPMSASMQRLTAKKESPDSKRSTDLASAAERKAKADELRKQKIIEQRRKDDERRAAVLERRKKLDEVEREKKEALFKKLTTKDPEDSLMKTSPMKKRYSLSTSNLSQMKKTKPVEVKIDLNVTTGAKKIETKIKERVKPLERPKSAMQRPTMGLPPDRSKTNDTKKPPDARRPMTAFGTRMPSAAKPPTKQSTRPSSSRQSLNITQPPRPATALGIANADKRKSSAPKQPRGSLTDKPPLSMRTMQKSKSATGLVSKESKKTSETAEKKTEAKKTTQTPDKKKTSTPMKKDTPKDNKEKPKTPKSSATSKERRENGHHDEKSADLPPNPKRSSKSSKETPKHPQLTEEEAKKALAERRKKAKEEAEAKAIAEREKDEVERLKREEEEKRLVEQLKVEEERNAALLEQLKREEEERRKKMMDEKEQREREEREKLEEEQRLREEEIERKAKLELDRIQKEQERQEILLDQERIERKKRVEMIMARVSSKRNTGLEEESSTVPVDSSSPPVASPPEVSSDPTRLKVNDILRSKGFGRSSEDISSLLDKHDDCTSKPEISANENNVYEQIQTNNESYTTIDDNAKSGGHGIKLLGSVVIDTPAHENNESVPLDESPSVHSHGTVSTDELPNVDASLEKYLTYNNSSLISDDISGYNEPCIESLELNDNDDASHTQSDNISSYINHELSETVDDISLAVNDNHTSLNDTNNNKDFLIENRSEPIIAWNENESITHASHEKIHQNHEPEGDHECLDKLSNQGHNDMPIFMNGNQEGKVINGSGDIHLVTGDSLLKSEDNSHATENDQWNKFDERMKQIQPPVDQVPGSEENKLWKVLEGKVELSECF